MSCFSKGMRSSKGSEASDTPSSCSAFSRLSSGTVAAGSLGVTLHDPIQNGESQKGGCAKAEGQSPDACALSRLEGAVSSLQATSEALVQAQAVFEEVCNENIAAARVGTFQCATLSVIADAWQPACWSGQRRQRGAGSADAGKMSSHRVQ